MFSHPVKLQSPTQVFLPTVPSEVLQQRAVGSHYTHASTGEPVKAPQDLTIRVFGFFLPSQTPARHGFCWSVPHRIPIPVSYFAASLLPQPLGASAFENPQGISVKFQGAQTPHKETSNHVMSKTAETTKLQCCFPSLVPVKLQLNQPKLLFLYCQPTSNPV